MRREAWRMLPERLGATVVMLLAAAAMWRRPIMADETDFMLAATHWPALGRLVPHPPGYLELIRLAFVIAGPGVGAARAVGVLCSLVTVWMIPGLARWMFGDSRRSERVARWGILFAVASPLVLQNMMLLDIDNTVATPAVLGVLMAWWATGRWPLTPRVIVMGVALAAAGWFKLPPPLLLAGTIAADAAWRRRGRDLAAALLATWVGALLFALAFELHRQATGFGYAELQGTFRKVAWLRDVRLLAGRLPQTAGVLLLWLSPGLVMLWCRGAVSPGIEPTPARARFGLVVTFTLVVMVFYAVALPPAWGYPKYQAIVLPLVAIVAAAAFEDAMIRVPKVALAWVAALIAACLALQLAWLGDPLLGAYRSTFETSIHDLRERAIAGIEAIAMSVTGVVVAALLAVAVARWRGWPRLAAVTAFVGAATLGALAGTSFLQSRADYSTRYHYGSSYSDLDRACRLLRPAAGASGFVVAPKEVLFYSGLDGAIVYDYVWETGSPDSILALTRRRRVDAFVWTTREARRAGRVLTDPRVRALLERDYAAESAGEYVLWIAKDRASAR